MATRRLHRFDILVRWFEEYLMISSYRPESIESWKYCLSRFRRWLDTAPELVDIDDITRDHLTAYTLSLYEDKLAVTTIHNKLALLKTFFMVLYRENKMYRNLASTLSLPRVGRRLPRTILTETEVEKLFDSQTEITNFYAPKRFDEATALRNHAILELFYSSGLRRGELIGLTLDSPNYRESTLFIANGKGGKDRVVPIGSHAATALARYVSEGRPFHVKNDTRALFLSRRGSGISKYSIKKIVDNALTQAGVEKKIRVHDLRHTCATHLLNNGAEIRLVQELLGHSDLSSTQVYTHVSIEKLKESHQLHHPREQWDE